MHQRGIDGDLAFDLVGMVVGDSISFLDFAQAGRRSGGEQAGFREGCLAGTSVAGECEVPNEFGGVVFHDDVISWVRS